MKVKIPYKFLEEKTWCEQDLFGEYLPYADDAEYEFTVDECKFDYTDLEDIVDEYTADIIDILLKKHRKELERRMKNGT